MNELDRTVAGASKNRPLLGRVITMRWVGDPRFPGTSLTVFEVLLDGKHLYLDESGYPGSDESYPVAVERLAEALGATVQDQLDTAGRP